MRKEIPAHSFRKTMFGILLTILLLLYIPPQNKFSSHKGLTIEILLSISLTLEAFMMLSHGQVEIQGFFFLCAKFNKNFVNREWGSSSMAI